MSRFIFTSLLFLLACHSPASALDTLFVKATSSGNWTTYSVRYGSLHRARGHIVTEKGYSPPMPALDGSHWFGAVRYDGETWVKYQAEDGLMNGRVRSVTQSPDGTMWFAGSHQGKAAVTRYDASARLGRSPWRIYSEADGLVGEWVGTAVVDRRGHLWVGTQGTTFWPGRTDPSAGGYGVLRFDGKKWQNFRFGDGLVHNRVYSIAAGKDGSVWFGTFGGVSRFDGENWTSYTRNDGMSGNKVHRIIVAQDGKVWCAHGEAGGISFFDGQNWMRYSKSNGMLASLVRSVSQSDDASLWFGTSRDEPGASGIVRYRDGAWLRILSEDGLPGEHARGLGPSGDGAVWMSVTGAGLVQYRPEPEGHFATLSGTVRRPDGSPWTGVPVRAEDGAGQARAGTRTGMDGTYRMKALPGIYRLVAGHAGTVDPVQVAVAAGEEKTGIDFTPILASIGGRVTRRYDGTTWAGLRVRVEDDEGRVQGEGTTGPDGGYQVWVRPGTYRVQMAEGHASDPVEVTVEVGQQLMRVDLVPIVGSIGGQVWWQGADRGWIDAKIRVEDLDGQVQGHTETNRYGGYRVWVRPGAYRVFMLDHKIMDPVEVTLRPGEQLEDVNFAVSPSPVIKVAGRVTDQAGRPVTGAKVSGLWVTSSPTGGRREIPEAETDEGYYTLDGIPGDTEQIHFRVKHPNFPGIQHLFLMDQLTATGLRQDFTMNAGGTVEGRVTASNRPVSGVRVRSTGPKVILGLKPSVTIPSAQRTRTDSLGRYSLTLPEGEESIIADHPDYGPVSAQISVAIGQTIIVDLALKAGEQVSGVVVTESGDLVAGAAISAFSQSRVGGSMRRAQSDSEGRFEIQGLAAGEVGLSVVHRTHGRLEHVQTTTGTTDLRLVLESSKRLSGRVIDGASGRPVDVFEVYLATAGNVYELTRPRQTNRLPGGRFELAEDITSGLPHTMVVTAPGYVRSLIEGVIAGSVTDEKGIVVTLSRGTTLRGRVMSDDGLPIANAKLQEIATLNAQWGVPFPLGHTDTYLASAHTDEKGVFGIDNVDADGIELWISHSDFADVTQNVVPAGPDSLTEFRMSVGLTIEGRVVRNGPVEGLQIGAHPKERPPIRPIGAEADADGRYRLEHLLPGVYRLMLLEGEGMDQIPLRSLEITLEKNTTIDFKPLGEGRILGIVVLDGEPVEGAHVMASIGGENRTSRTLVGGAKTGADGRYKLSDLPADRIFLDVTKFAFSQMGRSDQRLSATDEVNLVTTGEVEHRIDLKVD